MKKHARSFLLAALLSASVPCVAAAADTYRSLIQRARAGDYEPALEMLRQRTQEHPRDMRAAYDHMLIASWAGKSQEVISAYEALDPPPARIPAGSLAAVAHAYRDTQRWDPALALYREGIRRFPKDQTFAIGEIMTLADSGQAAAAVERGKELVNKSPTDPDRHIALGYAYQSQHAPYDALQQMDRAHTLAPNKSYVVREYIFALERAGLPGTALRVSQDHPDVLKASDVRRLQASQAAEMARMAATPAQREADRFIIADQALARYDQLIPAWEKLGPSAHADVIRARIDRLHALHGRMRMSELVKDYEQLRAEGVVVPRYALSDVAAAYLYLRQPEKARDLYRQIMANGASKQDSPAQQQADKIGLYYALIESESFDEADAVLKQARTDQKPWYYLPGQPYRIPNDLYLTIEQTAALGKLYDGDAAGAQKRLSQLVERAPNNTGLRTALASVYRSRDQPRLAEQELKLAETQAPRNKEVENGQGETALSLQEWRQAELLTQDTLARFPEDDGTQRLAREWQVHNKAELRVTGERGISSNSPVSGNGDLAIDTVMYSAPINYNWRAFAGGGYAEGNFEEGNGYYRWLRTGVEWRSRGVTAEAEVSSNNYGFGERPGMRLSASFDLSDQWQIGASGALQSRDTPLRALKNDIFSNTLQAFVRWHPDDERDWNLSLSPSHFSDGNDRWALGLAGRQRLYTGPRFKADLGLELAASHNSRQDVPYFNPRADLTVMPTLALTHVLYRRYETVLEQKLTLGAGTYTEQGFGTGAIGSIGYGLRYRANNVFEMGASVTGISRPYDGQRERDILVMVDMTVRF